MERKKIEKKILKRIETAYDYGNIYVVAVYVEQSKLKYGTI